MKIKALQSKPENRVFWLSVILCTLYQSYRYPLQISSSGTSPTYSDTPVLLQAGKFALAVPLFAIATLQCFRKTGSLQQWLIVSGAIFLSCFSLFKLLGDKDARYLDLSYWLLFALALAWAVDSVKVSTLDRYFCYLLFFAVGSTLVEVFLFLAFGRLPALAFEGTYLIRFGGFWDDPNGFAAVLFLLMGWSYARFKGWSRFFVLAGIIVCLLLTQSWTGLAFFLLISFIWGMFKISKRPIIAAATICAVSLLVAFVIRSMTRSVAEIAADVLTSKQGSIEGHLFPWVQWSSKWIDWVFLGDWKYNPYESWWAGAMVNFGVPWLCACFGLVATLVATSRSALSRAVGDARPVQFGIFLFGCYFVFGCLGLPLFAVFPINFFFFLFSFLVAFGKLRIENGPLVNGSVGDPQDTKKMKASFTPSGWSRNQA